MREIVAINNQEFLVDERDGKGRGAQIKQLFKVDLAGAVDVTGMDGLTASANAVGKTLFLDIVKVLTANGISTTQIPAKLEGLAFGSDVTRRFKWLAVCSAAIQLNRSRGCPTPFRGLCDRVGYLILSPMRLA